ncbi:FAD-dependent oxidoreductase [Curvivirga sp.]|uniref:FAD-dependent oxidoreductase n=1 Tax=Curvivirga sp. TaxID=2856848 RepID=UPI003B5A36F0
MTLKIAVIGAGPSGIYVAEGIKKKLPDTMVDFIERLPTPFGLVRFGVAPDHQGTKKVINQYEKFFDQDGIRLIGNVEVGKDISVQDLQEHYDAVVIANGAREDKRLGIPGEDLDGVYGSAAFVSWYNSHPDYKDLSPIPEHAKSAIVIGNGNVAIDVARILVKSAEEMSDSDLADYTRAAIDKASISDVVIAGRRGPAEASFTPPELRELGKLEHALPVIEGAVIPDELPSHIDTSQPAGRIKGKVLDIFRSFTEMERDGKDKTIHLQFLASPTAFLGEEKVEAVQFERMELNEDGKPTGTGELFDIPADLVVSAIGYYSQPLAGVPFDEKLGRYPNEEGLIQDNLYVVGWGKRGPSGTIPTNRPCSFKTSQIIMDQITANPAKQGGQAIDKLLAEKGCKVTTFADWKAIDAAETKTEARQKIASVDEMLAII